MEQWWWEEENVWPSADLAMMVETKNEMKDMLKTFRREQKKILLNMSKFKMMISKKEAKKMRYISVNAEDKKWRR